MLKCADQDHPMPAGCTWLGRNLQLCSKNKLAARTTLGLTRGEALRYEAGPSSLSCWQSFATEEVLRESAA